MKGIYSTVLDEPWIGLMLYLQITSGRVPWHGHVIRRRGQESFRRAKSLLSVKAFRLWIPRFRDPRLNSRDSSEAQKSWRGDYFLPRRRSAQ